ncbi:hypothetical protein DAI22_11g199550 [Oryza sativa Japonica Group]|nr:hypothetical protein DAI22_11g199550 [Oryza sativa Japonica Group]
MVRCGALCFSDSSRWMSKYRSDTYTCHIQSAHVKAGHMIFFFCDCFQHHCSITLKLLWS